jgi:hypothetical protein
MTSPKLGEGLLAYAAKQHALLQEIGAQFAAQWYGVVATNGLEMNWPAHFIPESPQMPDAPMLSSSTEFDDSDILFFDEAFD